jgi:hypothetical protein
MPRQYKPDPKCKKYIKYKKEDIAKAFQDLRANKLSYRVAAAKYNIEYTVLYRHNTRNNIKTLGGQTVLSPKVENIIVENINACADWGFPMDRYDLRLLVKIYLDKKGIESKRFKNNMPGVEFAGGFLKRHKNKISERYAQNIKRARANVSSESINNYFNELTETLINTPPANIVNYDETNLTDDPGRKKVIVKRGSKYPERVMNTTKCSISLMMAGTAAGYLFPPYVIYKAQHLYDLWKVGGPKGARYNRTASGWIDIITFEDWIKTVIIPYARGVDGTTYLIGDNLSCHLSLDVIKICTESDIRLVFLPPNSSHLTQPLDVAFFRPLKIAWREILLQWKKKEGSKEKSLPKSVFPRLLNSLYNKIQTNAETNLKSGFKKTGIFPLNRQEVLSRLPDCSSEANNDTNIVSESVIDLLKLMRQGEEEEPQKKKKRLEVVPGKSVDDTEILSLKDKNKETKEKSKKGGKPNKGKIKSSKPLLKDKIIKIKNENSKKEDIKADLNITAVNQIVRDFEPRAGPSNILMCRICHSVKKRDDTWIKCIVCKNQICRNCAGDVLAIEFICLRCLHADSDDSAVDEDYNPVKSGYSAYDEGSLSSD